MSKQNNKPFYKQWWSWTIIIIIVLISIVMGISKNTTKNHVNNSPVQNNHQQTELGEKYELTTEKIGDYGRIVTLNKDSDIPVDKYLYKLPAGNYRITTTNKKYSAFSIVKDEIGIEEGEYPEVLQYVGEQYLLTSSDNDLNGHAKKEVIVNLRPDESISLNIGSFITVQEIVP